MKYIRKCLSFAVMIYLMIVAHIAQDIPAILHIPGRSPYVKIISDQIRTYSYSGKILGIF